MCVSIREIENREKIDKSYPPAIALCMLSSFNASEKGVVLKMS